MKKKKVIIPTILLILIIGGFLYWHFMASQKSLTEAERANAYKQILGRDVREEKKIETKGFQGKYFSLDYPSNLSVKEATTSAQQKTETLRMLGFDPRLNLVVMAVNGEGIVLQDYSAIKFRRDNDKYKSEEKMAKINGIDALIFTGVESPEKTAFLKKDDMIYSISVTGSNKSEVEKLFDSVTQTINF